MPKKETRYYTKFEPDLAAHTIHAGYIISEFRAKCKCGYRGPIREFHCDASQDLWNHFEKKGTLLPIPDFGGWINGRRDLY